MILALILYRLLCRDIVVLYRIMTKASRSRATVPLRKTNPQKERRDLVNMNKTRPVKLC